MSQLIIYESLEFISFLLFSLPLHLRLPSLIPQQIYQHRQIIFQQQFSLCDDYSCILYILVSYQLQFFRQRKEVVPKDLKAQDLAQGVILDHLWDEVYIQVVKAALLLQSAFGHMQVEVFSQIFCIVLATTLMKLPVFWMITNSFIKYILFTNWHQSQQLPIKIITKIFPQFKKAYLNYEQQIQIDLNIQLIILHMNLKPNPEDNGVITKQFLKKLCKTDFKNYYSTPYLNDILYLHYKGFTKIDNLQEYTGLKVIYMEGNAIRRIQGLQKLTNLRCLYLQENMIGKISGLETLTGLANLNLSDNLISKVEGLQNLTNLSNLQLKGNRIGQAGLEDLVGLLACPSISALDISVNKIQTEQFLPEILYKMPNIAVIYMHTNDFTKKISHYRKTVISKLPNIKYIDDKPVFEDQLRFSVAWARGGLEQQRKQRALYKKEKEDEQVRQHEQFRKMIQRYKQEGRRQKERAQSSQSDSEANSKPQSLQTYKSPVDSHQASEITSSKQSQPSQNASDKALSQKVSEKSLSEKDHAQSDHEQVQKEISEQIKKEQKTVNQGQYKAQERNKASYLDQLD